jgi:hypothetical protein
MSDDPIEVLERELVDAARRRSSGRDRRRRVSLGGLAAAIMVAVTLAVAAGALILLGGHKRSTASGAVPGRQQLIDTLGVLRRPQTPADLNSPAIVRFLQRYRGGHAPPDLAAQGTPDIPLIRRATVTPWGAGVFLIPMKPASAQAIADLRRQSPGFPAGFFERPGLRGERLEVQVGFGGGCCSTAADIEAGYELTTEGAGRAFAGGSTGSRLTLIVPDGVARVVFVIPRQSRGGSPGAPIYPRSLKVGVPVHNNVAAVQVNRECCGGQLAMIWYGSNGRVMKRIGNLAAVNRVLPAPKPAPETLQSRAAERDPSTPNRVWVTPATGNQHAKYAVHFRVLLNDADYRFHMSGTSCAQITFAGGGGGGSGDLRGRILSYDLDAVTGQTWCPGTYHVSVSVMDLGRYGNLKHPAKAFGNATFTVLPAVIKG